MDRSYLAGKIHIVELTSSDHNQLEQKGISEVNLDQQLQIFSKGIEPTSLTRACTIDDGIVRLTEAQIEANSATYISESADLKVLKFVPASGAASRMFKHLHQYDSSNPDALSREFIDRFDEMPFAKSIHSLQAQPSKEEKISLTIGDRGLRYASAPKGMVLFHGYGEMARTAFEEHLVEGALYAGNEKVNIHFTVAEGKENEIGDFLRLQSTGLGRSYDLSFSTQKAFTDTVAVTMDNQPYRDDYGQLLFRPGGHGALIHNLNENPADLIFIKNIDNVVHETRIEETILWKQVLGGTLIKIRSLIHAFLAQHETGEVPEDQLQKIKGILGLRGVDQSEMAKLLRAPIRVCGMVKNEGEPGGGPFWVEGNSFPQVVESAQISSSEDQQAVVSQATHFNPTDLVCSTLDHRGEPYNLLDFVDPTACFISEKSISGTAVKALELPGLWNGAMANWVSIFVEVPVSTFNPVKTVNDLLRPMHQPK